MDQIKPIHVTIEKIKVVRYPYGYVVSIDKALEVFRKYNSNYKVKIRKVIDSITVTKGVNQAFFDIFEDLFQNPNFKKAQ